MPTDHEKQARELCASLNLYTGHRPRPSECPDETSLTICRDALAFAVAEKLGELRKRLTARVAHFDSYSRQAVTPIGQERVRCKAEVLREALSWLDELAPVKGGEDHG